MSRLQQHISTSRLISQRHHSLLAFAVSILYQEAVFLRLHRELLLKELMSIARHKIR